ncbi:hypothetical protein ENSA7_18010 [Enhygromyxa salina]|uniref:Outer membrane or secreted lipoprotein n=1 Tax=Enhygromyxa salina TaxID=215803 RepID=A0A2S9YTS7_9BACT|nr:OBAP family protein [Enhygromyxa salina]PRQ08515.1 hypothetical protein ENSA7_18010 [Enhygromyxa salina]
MTPPGEEAGAITQLLSAGAELFQADSPIDQLNIHLVGFHPMKEDPYHQMDVHHFCHQVNEDFAQCALWDGDTAQSNLNGIEYIISERLFEGLPEQEKQYWHPHNFEILSGQLVAPGLPPAADLALMRGKMNSYGKTWHTWLTGGGTRPGDGLPLGEARLAWSFNAAGELEPALLEARERMLDIDTQQRRVERSELVELAHPQRGVDALAQFFPDRHKPEGVVDDGEATPIEMDPQEQP